MPAKWATTIFLKYKGCRSPKKMCQKNMEFDHNYYYFTYPDLLEKGLETEEDAQIHWQNYGRNENKKRYGMKCGFAVSTYHRNTDRLESFQTCITSIMKHKKKETLVIVVDDGSAVKDHILWVKTTFPEITLFEKEQNGGIAKCKNTCLRLLRESNCDNFFLMDDDLEVLQPIEDVYVKALCDKRVGILSGTTLGNVILRDYTDSTCVTQLLNGFLLCLPRYNFEKAGYFKIFPHKYGHEHTWYTFRVMTTTGQTEFLNIKSFMSHVRLINVLSSVPSEEVHSGFDINGKILAQWSGHLNREECLE
jgi:glycosyltransferase involved in cell wall biosynthesis